MDSLYSRSHLSPDPTCGSNWGHKIDDFVFLPYISLIIAFTALECMERYRKPYSQSLDSLSDLPLTPSYGSNWGHKIADFVFWPYISFSIAFTALECIVRL